jgi:hypothetical protein
VNLRTFKHSIPVRNGPIIQCRKVLPQKEMPTAFTSTCEPCDTSQRLECTRETEEEAKVSTSESRMCCEKGRSGGGNKSQHRRMTQVILFC